MNKFIFSSEVYFILIDNVKHEIYQGINKKPFYYLGNKEVYLSPNDKENLDNLIIATDKAV